MSISLEGNLDFKGMVGVMGSGRDKSGPYPMRNELPGGRDKSGRPARLGPE